jgi:hypothetical protein
MKNLISSIVFIGLFASCNSAEKVPDGIIPDSVMSKILVEIAITDAAFNLSLTRTEYPKFRQELFYEKIMKDHETSREQFIESLGYYAIETKRFQKIYENALSELSKKQVQEIK